MNNRVRFIVGIIGCILLFGMGLYQLAFGPEGNYPDWLLWFFVISSPISAMGMYRNYKSASP
ncbi:MULTISPECIES: hypothetical protein [Pontibacillus]|uniref:DUF5668 domain-containing protein n=1 Tax=Pontibacillus chungwhensis TaxID=265426 RepID=A0ABY8UZM5_9BACI|nr:MULTISPECIES: hypothetical protein [Pontibacillus]MCD5324569.1 hypothetical protein [Pontibacillus sp. HN14]WIF99135.1 hypothetical protein QNI29_05625 [Pontibacillus chungwhensis]